MIGSSKKDQEIWEMFFKELEELDKQRIESLKKLGTLKDLVNNYEYWEDVKKDPSKLRWANPNTIQAYVKENIEKGLAIAKLRINDETLTLEKAKVAIPVEEVTLANLARKCKQGEKIAKTDRSIEAMSGFLGTAKANKKVVAEQITSPTPAAKA